MDNHAQNIKKLVNGRSDLMVFDLTLSNLSMKKLGLSPDDIEVVYSFNRMDLYYAFNKYADKKIIQRLNVELKKFKQAEEGKQSPFDSLKEKYIGPKANHINYHLPCNREISQFCSELELFYELKLAYDVVK